MATASSGGNSVPGTFTYTATLAGGTAVPVTSSTVLSAGTYTLTATFTPTNSTTYATVTLTASLTVGAATANVALVASANPVLATNPVTFTATVTATSGTPTGSVNFYDGTTLLASATLSSGKASYTISSLAATTHSITAVYSGDGNFVSVTSSAVSLAVNKATPAVTLVSSVNPVLVSNPITFTATVTATSGTPTGSVNFYDGTTLLASATLSSGKASYTISNLAAATHSITAVYGGDGNFVSVTSSAVSLAVNKATPAVTLVSSVNPVLVTNPVTFTATVTATSGTPTGSVNFYDGTTLLASATLSSGKASYTTSSLAAATHSITAVYGGDGNFVSVTSSAVAELVQDYTVGISGSSGGSGSGGSSDDSSSQTVIPGGTATYTLALGPSNGTVFPSEVTLSLSGLPPGATATITPQTLPAGSSLTNVTLSVQLPTPTAKSTSNPLYRSAAPIALGLLLLPFAARLRKVSRKLNGTIFIVLLGIAGAASLFGLSGCGTHLNGFFGQAQKSYTITITATSGNLQHSTAVTLIVQ
jgi:hypothetical protein